MLVSSLCREGSWWDVDLLTALGLIAASLFRVWIWLCHFKFHLPFTDRRKQFVRSNETVGKI